MNVREYNWKHIPSGKSGTKLFNDSFHTNDPGRAALLFYAARYADDSVPRASALAIVNEWNKPTWSDYRYWID